MNARLYPCLRNLAKFSSPFNTGTPAQCRERLAELRDAGVDLPILITVYGRPRNIQNAEVGKSTDHIEGGVRQGLLCKAQLLETGHALESMQVMEMQPIARRNKARRPDQSMPAQSNTATWTGRMFLMASSVR